MKHHQYNPNYEFVVPPVDFNKYTDRSLLQYCLGATMYMPGTKDFAQAVIDKKYPGLTSMVMCFEDACPEEDVPAAELNSIHVLDTLKEAEDSGKLKYEDSIWSKINDIEDKAFAEEGKKNEAIRDKYAPQIVKVGEDFCDEYFKNTNAKKLTLSDLENMSKKVWNDEHNEYVNDGTMDMLFESLTDSKKYTFDWDDDISIKKR